MVTTNTAGSMGEDWLKGYREASARELEQRAAAEIAESVLKIKAQEFVRELKQRVQADIGGINALPGLKEISWVDGINEFTVHRGEFPACHLHVEWRDPGVIEFTWEKTATAGFWPEQTPGRFEIKLDAHGGVYLEYKGKKLLQPWEASKVLLRPFLKS